ncbi:transposase [Bacteroidetes oral taxon 274 str. F0058]|nr:transposase [Bacteroidetes oral taxon 274 str. F0058]
MKHLNELQRYTIRRMRKDKKTQSEIARYIGASQAIVSKKFNRSSDTSGRSKAQINLSDNTSPKQ